MESRQRHCIREKDGTIPDKYNTLILKDVMENSKLMQLAKYEEMDGKEKKFEYFAEGPGAYWVGEGEKIKTSKPKWLNVTMTAKNWCYYPSFSGIFNL